MSVRDCFSCCTERLHSGILGGPGSERQVCKAIENRSDRFPRMSTPAKRSKVCPAVSRRAEVVLMLSCSLWASQVRSVFPCGSPSSCTGTWPQCSSNDLMGCARLRVSVPLARGALITRQGRTHRIRTALTSRQRQDVDAISHLVSRSRSVLPLKAGAPG